MACLDDVHDEDSALIKQLKTIDDQTLALAKERDQLLKDLQVKFTAKQAPLLDERVNILADNARAAQLKFDKSTGGIHGTPSVRGFWLTALMNHPCFASMIKEWDMGVLLAIKNIRVEDLEDSNPNSSFRIVFEFVENEYIADTQLTKTYRMHPEPNPYTGDADLEEVSSSKITWRPGKDVTYGEKKRADSKKSGKVAKKKSTVLQPRASFFRVFFRSLDATDNIPDDVDLTDILDSGCKATERQIVKGLLYEEYVTGTALRDEIVPYAVRWYTGEARPEGDYDDEEEEEEETYDEDSDDESPKQLQPRVRTESLD